jgi:hypothetical protein
MHVNAQARDDVLQTAREYGAALGEHIIAVFGEQIPNEKVDEAVAFVTAEIFRRIEEMSSQNVAAVIVLDWGHECMNALQDRILEHTGYLLMAAALERGRPRDWHRKGRMSTRHLDVICGIFRRLATNADIGTSLNKPGMRSLRRKRSKFGFVDELSGRAWESV